jgi:hypothetical protein
MSNTMISKPRFTKGTRAALMSDPARRPATERQIQFMVDLVKQVAEFDKVRARALWNAFKDEQTSGTLTFGKASESIEFLKALRTELRMTAHGVHQTSQDRPQVPEGRYAVDTDEGHLGFYRVHVSKSGYVTVAVMASDTERALLTWKVQLGVLRKIALDPKAAAIRYGQEVGVCGRCGRTLTDEKSRAAGVGPDCATKF